MNEFLWLSAADPVAMLDSLNRSRWRTLLLQRRTPSERKLRLLLVALGRNFGPEDVASRRHTLPDGTWSYNENYTAANLWHAVLDEAERMADGLSVCSSSASSYPGASAIFLTPSAASIARRVLTRLLPEGQPARETAASLIRDLFGNPFRPVAFKHSWRTEHAVGLALRMYEDRDFGAMPILADALEEAGCDNADILAHCRESGEHVPGCWVVDSLLARV